MAKLINLNQDNDLNTFEEKIKRHQKILYMIGLLGIIGSVAIFGYKKSLTNTEQTTQSMMIAPVFEFEKGNYLYAVEGDSEFVGLEKIVKQYGSSKSGNLAKFYLGISYMKLNRFEEAIQTLSDTKLYDLIISTQIFGAIGDCYSQLNNSEKAIEFYRKASQNNPNKYITPYYLEKIAFELDGTGKTSEALEVYKEIYDTYPDYKHDFIGKMVARLS